MLLKKKLLYEVGGFCKNYGMSGNRVSYGEEDHVQMLLKESGIRIGYDPDLVIFHLVPKYKLSVRWFLKAAFEKGTVYLEVRNYQRSIDTLLLSFMIGISQLLVFSIVNLPKLFRKSYYFQNYFLDTFRKPLKWFGICRAYFYKRDRTKQSRRICIKRRRLLITLIKYKNF